MKAIVSPAISMVSCATDTETRDISVEKVLEGIRIGGKMLKGQITQIRNRFEAKLAPQGWRPESRKARCRATEEGPARSHVVRSVFQS